MAALSNVDIKKIVNKNGLVINPFNCSQLTGVGYDLSIGCIVDVDSQILPESNNGKYLLEGGHRYIIITKEYVWLSRYYMGTLHARGSLALEGISTTSTTVDPNFKGHMVMCIINLSSSPISIKENETFITLVIHKLRTSTKLPLAITEGGHVKIAQRKISSIFPEETDARRAKLNDYLATQEQMERSINVDAITRANMRNYFLDLVKDWWHSTLPSKWSMLIGLTTLFLIAIIALCIYSLFDSKFIGMFVPNYSNTNMFQIPAIIAAIAALIALHKKK